ncbi:hypothetical protein GQ53DRAFT_262615 [Thozetella sp. PMI_491]|nr:hypothetical protein GQ53DRAFT_262615 [Thozetella sp. PMI_491]
MAITQSPGQVASSAFNRDSRAQNRCVCYCLAPSCFCPFSRDAPARKKEKKMPGRSHRTRCLRMQALPACWWSAACLYRMHGETRLQTKIDQ